MAGRRSAGASLRGCPDPIIGRRSVAAAGDRSATDRGRRGPGAIVRARPHFEAGSAMIDVSGRRSWVRRTAAVALAVCVLPAHAQYQWRDANGRMVFSDQPPPPSVKPGNVLRAEPMPSPVGRPQGASARELAADRELARRQKAAEQAGKAERERQQAEQSARLARACEEGRTELRTLESGMRMARVNKDGEREYLDDAERDKRIAALRRDLNEVCKAG